MTTGRINQGAEFALLRKEYNNNSFLFCATFVASTYADDDAYYLILFQNRGEKTLLLFLISFYIHYMDFIL